MRNFQILFYGWKYYPIIFKSKDNTLTFIMNWLKLSNLTINLWHWQNCYIILPKVKWKKCNMVCIAYGHKVTVFWVLNGNRLGASIDPIVVATTHAHMGLFYAKREICQYISIFWRILRIDHLLEKCFKNLLTVWCYFSNRCRGETHTL